MPRENVSLRNLSNTYACCPVILKNCLTVSLVFEHYKYILLILKKGQHELFSGIPVTSKLYMTVDLEILIELACLSGKNNIVGNFSDKLLGVFVDKYI